MVYGAGSTHFPNLVSEQLGLLCDLLDPPNA